MKTLAERLIAEREAKGWSQPKLAHAAGISQSFIGALETGRQQSSAWLPEIAYALGLHALWLKTGKGPKTFQLTAEEPPSPYASNVLTLNPPSRLPLRMELDAIVARMSERALQVLIYEAEKIERAYPANKSKPCQLIMFPELGAGGRVQKSRRHDN